MYYAYKTKQLSNFAFLTLFGPKGLQGVNFFAITQKEFELASLNFLIFLTNTSPSLKAKNLAFIPTA